MADERGTADTRSLRLPSPECLRRFIEYRDGTCQFPGCSRPASSGEIDHIVEWQDGGATDAENLQALCRKHHALKSLRLWSSRRLEPNSSDVVGKVLWVSPLGARVLAGPLERRDDDPPDPGKDPHDGPPPF
ncbi:HNH endonuclease signature motif containing protein [Sinomonas terricola]|uniref:HNH endonuclease signature motif containing protein n=1 Tax=Sinomonas terricola TaxID=3110330 RepID=UPI003D17444D